MWPAYVEWAGVPEHRLAIWFGSLVLLLIYVVIENWGQPWMDDDDWHDEPQI